MIVFYMRPYVISLQSTSRVSNEPSEENQSDEESPKMRKSLSVSFFLLFEKILILDLL